MGGKRLANMGKRRRPTYKNTFNAQRSCILDTVTGQGKMVLVREKSGNFDFSSLWEPCLTTEPPQHYCAVFMH